MIRAKRFVENAATDNIDTQMNAFLRSKEGDDVNQVLELKMSSHFNPNSGNVIVAVLIYNDEPVEEIPGVE